MGDATLYESCFNASIVPQAPQNPFYGIIAAYEADPSEQKVDLGVGAYRDDDAKPWILPVVRKASQIYVDDPNTNNEYLPSVGLPTFINAAQRLILGTDSAALRERRVCSIQTLSGTGAVHIGAKFLAKCLPYPAPPVYLSAQTWPTYREIFSSVDMSIKSYPYYSTTTRMLDFEGITKTLKSMPRGSIVVLQPCAHNPTGIDPTEEQWRRIAQLIQRNGLFPFFDCAYQGFASGAAQKDNFAIRHFAEQGIDFMIAQSFSKNLGLYGQRVGALHFVGSPSTGQESLKNVLSQLVHLQCLEIWSPPIYGAKITSIVLNDKELHTEWEHDLHSMFNRIVQMRKFLRQELEAQNTPGQWDHITSQCGMFSFLGLSEDQVAQLRDKWHLYMLPNSRISVAGLNTKNVKYVARAIDDVVRRIDS